MDYSKEPQTDRELSVTFIFGNGFDLNLKLRTSFEDMYDEYTSFPSDFDAVNQFKEDLMSDKDKRYSSWSDFEMGMAEYAKKLYSENELIQCLRNFKDHMIEHLKYENERFKQLIYNAPNETQEMIAKVVNDSFDNYYTKLVKKTDIRKIGALYNNICLKENYITFNYTDTLETILRYRRNATKLEKPIHIHGDLDSHVILGIDNMDQISGIRYKLSNKGKRCFLKPFLNNALDDLLIEEVENIISNSSIICIYGFSMGPSDKMWNELIVKWLHDSPNHHLIVFQHDKYVFQNQHIDLMIEFEDQEKQKMMNKLGVKNESVFDQIHIPIGKSIFNFDFWNGYFDFHMTNEEIERMLSKI